MLERHDRDEAVRQLIELNVVRSDGGSLRTTRRFQAAMARAAARLARANEARFDLRIPIATALLELHATRAAEAPTDDALARLVEVVLPIEAPEQVWPTPPP